jgi:hypothetical protein
VKVKLQAFPGQKSDFEQIREYQNLADDLFDINVDVHYMNIFVD